MKGLRKGRRLITMTLPLMPVFVMSAPVLGEISIAANLSQANLTQTAPIQLVSSQPDNLPSDLQSTDSQRSIAANNVRQLILTNACMGCDLAGADLSEAHLIGADLRQANLQGADLTDVNLEGADLTGANLAGANLTDAFLTNAVMAEANLNDVNFTGAHLYYVDVSGASVQNIDLTRAQVLHTPLSIGGTEPLDADYLPELSVPEEEAPGEIE